MACGARNEDRLARAELRDPEPELAVAKFEEATK